ncbi:hypothetical protein PENSPDRAFT_608095 [Peniophora sp. CONT]|nr:hypothetical protein PENSPDRAFT_608095 [Peniophora sp. CONT]
MCWLAGSIEYQTSVCPMCTFFKSTNARCPHKRDICRNVGNHPREVAYIKNAEVATFNGCGYCKWARQSPGTRNTGWPGCCRPPGAGERIPPADWPAVSAVHGVQVPQDVKTLLDSINVPKPGSPQSKQQSSSPNLGSPTQSSRSSPSATQAKPPRTPPLAIPPRATRALAKERKDKDSPERQSTSNSKDASPNTPSPLRRPSVSRAPKQPATDERTPPATLRRRSSTADARRDQPPARERERDIPPRNATIGPSRTAPRASALDTDFGMGQMSLNSPLSPTGGSGSDGGSVSGGSSSDGTVTSDGGFTDYLSDESEAELQRQAEARALVLAQSHAEDAEFRAARKQLAQVDLRVPKAWNTGTGTQKGLALGGYARR